MRKLFVCLLIVLPICFGVSVKKGGSTGTSVTSIVYFHLATEDIADVSDDYVGCKWSNQFDLAKIVDEQCIIPAGVRKKIHKFGVHIAIVDETIPTCKVGIAVDGVDISDTLITMGGSGLDGVGESFVVTLANPSWYTQGQRITYRVRANGASCDDNDADLKRVVLFTQIETEFP